MGCLFEQRDELFLARLTLAFLFEQIAVQTFVNFSDKTLQVSLPLSSYLFLLVEHLLKCVDNLLNLVLDFSNLELGLLTLGVDTSLDSRKILIEYILSGSGFILTLGSFSVYLVLDVAESLLNVLDQLVVHLLTVVSHVLDVFA